MLMLMFIAGPELSRGRGTFHQQTSGEVCLVKNLILRSISPKTESVVNNAASLTSDDEDEGADDEDSAEGSADQMLVF